MAKVLRCKNDESFAGLKSKWSKNNLKHTLELSELSTFCLFDGRASPLLYGKSAMKWSMNFAWYSDLSHIITWHISQSQTSAKQLQISTACHYLTYPPVTLKYGKKQYKHKRSRQSVRLDFTAANSMYTCGLLSVMSAGQPSKDWPLDQPRD